MKKTVLERLRNSEKPIVIFGAGLAGRRFYDYLRKSSQNIRLVFCDNYKTGKEEFTDGEIISPKCLAEKYFDSTVSVCVITPKLHEQVVSQIREMGFADSNIITYDRIFEAVKAETDGGISWQDAEATFDWELNRLQYEKISRWIDEKDFSVIDFGAGKAAVLKRFLRPSIKYIPTDYIARTSEFLKYDFNSDPFPDISADVCVLNHVLYYAEDWQGLLRNTFGAAKRKVVVGIKIIGRTENLLKQVHFDSEKPIVGIAGECGFTLRETEYLDKDAWNRQNISLLFGRIK